MLSSESADLVRRDQRVPGLATLLHADRFVATLRGRLPDVDLIGGELRYIRYKPGVNCLAGYRLATRHGAFDVYGKAYGTARAVKVNKARDLPAVSGHMGPGRLVVADESVVVSTFPNDFKLRTLLELGGEPARRRLLRSVLGQDSPLCDGALQQLSYKPERRYVAKLVGADGKTCVLKFYGAGGFEPAYRAQSAFSAREDLGLPRKIGRSRRRRVLAFEWLPGSRLRDLIRERSHGLEQIAAVGAALRSLHRRSPGSASTRSRAAEAAALSAMAEGLAFLLPKLADRAAHVVNRLQGWLAVQPPPSALIHGDFYDKQIVVGSDGVGILDLDEAVFGDPRADLGLFIAHLERDAISGKLGADRVAAVADALRAGYSSAGGEPTTATLHPYAAACLLQLAHHPFRSGQPDWARQTEQIVERAEQLALE